MEVTHEEIALCPCRRSLRPRLPHHTPRGRGRSRPARRHGGAVDRPRRHERPRRRRRVVFRIRRSSMSAPPPAASGSPPTAGSPGSRSSTTSRSPRSAPSPSIQPNPDVVWVGTGEGNPRNSVSVGNGIYRSLDGGRTWQHLGLEKTEHIHDIFVHPTDSRTRLRRRPRPGLGREPRARRLQDGGRRQDLEANPLRRRAHRRRRSGHGPVQPAASSSRRCGTTGAGPGPSAPAAPAPASTSPTTAAPAGRR